MGEFFGSRRFVFEGVWLVVFWVKWGVTQTPSF
jgi:hypothetical protein